MKVKKLLKLLEKIDPNAEVILSSDSEGNSFSLLAYVSDENAGYIKEFGGIQLVDRELTEELKEQGMTNEDVNPKAKKCVILWP